MIVEVDDIGKCTVVKDLWFTLPDWQRHEHVCVGIIGYINEHREFKQVIGICTGENIIRDVKMIIAGGVPCNVVIN